MRFPILLFFIPFAADHAMSIFIARPSQASGRDGQAPIEDIRGRAMVCYSEDVVDGDVKPWGTIAVI